MDKRRQENLPRPARRCPEKLRRWPTLKALFLGFNALCTFGCDHIGSRTMVAAPSAHLEAQGEGIAARIERFQVDYVSKIPKYRVDVTIRNDRPQRMQVAPEKVELAQLESADRSHESTEQALPLLLLQAVDGSVVDGDKHIKPGAQGTYRILLPRTPLDDGQPYALLLDGALGLSRGTLPPVPLVRPDVPHFGYLPPSEPTWVFAGRLGGGVVVRPPAIGGLGGFEIFVGRQWGRLAVGGFATLGAGAWGGEMRMRFSPGKTVTLIPFFGYGYYPIVGFLGFNAGHGARWGFELQFSAGNTVRFGYPRNMTKVGLYALAGPVFLRVIDGVGVAGQIGLSFGVF